jgi:hypothetical protein
VDRGRATNRHHVGLKDIKMALKDDFKTGRLRTGHLYLRLPLDEGTQLSESDDSRTSIHSCAMMYL